MAVAANQVKPVASVSQEKILRPLPFVAAAEFKQANSASALTIEHAMRRSIEIDALRKTALEHQQVRSRCCRTLPVGCQRRSYRWLSEWSLSARRAGRCLRRSAVTVLYDGLKIRFFRTICGRFSAVPKPTPTGGQAHTAHQGRGPIRGVFWASRTVGTAHLGGGKRDQWQDPASCAQPCAPVLKAPRRFAPSPTSPRPVAGSRGRACAECWV